MSFSEKVSSIFVSTSREFVSNMKRPKLWLLSAYFNRREKARINKQIGNWNKKREKKKNQVKNEIVW